MQSVKRYRVSERQMAGLGRQETLGEIEQKACDFT